MIECNLLHGNKCLLKALMPKIFQKPFSFDANTADTKWRMNRYLCLKITYYANAQQDYIHAFVFFVSFTRLICFDTRVRCVVRFILFVSCFLCLIHLINFFLTYLCQAMGAVRIIFSYFHVFVSLDEFNFVLFIYLSTYIALILALCVKL
jgi:hypothetical protein